MDETVVKTDSANSSSIEEVGRVTIPSGGPSAEELIRSSVTHYRAKQFLESVADCNLALSINPNYPEAYNNLAAAYLAMSEWDLAIGAASRAVQIEPSFERAKNILARARNQKERSLYPTQNFYGELATYLEQDRDLVEQRCQIARVELAWQWMKANGNLTKYYRDTDLHIFDHTLYQTMQQENGKHAWYRRMLGMHGWNSILDYRGGIGEWTIIPTEMGIQTTFMERKESPAMIYAQWRFKHRHLSPEVMLDNAKLKRHYDVIVAMDVFEKLEDPSAAIEEVCEHADYIFANPDEVQYNLLYPRHVSHYDLTAWCDLVEGSLWKVRR